MEHYDLYKETWIEREEACSPSGAQLRKGRAYFPDGVIRAFRAGIPDTWFSIPAHARVRGVYLAGYVTTIDNPDPETEHYGELEFRPNCSDVQLGRLAKLWPELYSDPNAKHNPYRPTTGQACTCKIGDERDNCPQCEGTGLVIDFRAIRERKGN